MHADIIISPGDLAAFERANRAVLDATRRDGAEIVNRALKNVAYKAAQLTEAAKPAKIQQDMERNQLALKIASKKHRGANAKKIRQAARKIIAKRKTGARVMRVGWFKPLKDLGGGGGAVRAGGIASRGFAHKATPGRMVGDIGNASYAGLRGPAAATTGAKMRAALTAAVRAVTAEQVEYARRRIAATLRRHSA